MPSGVESIQCLAFEVTLEGCRCHPALGLTNKVPLVPISRLLEGSHPKFVDLPVACDTFVD